MRGPTCRGGDALFATKPGPGWAKDGKWDDPRVGKEGPLPRDWAHYKGLYVHGDKVVLSYTVGDMDVLEMPEAFETEGWAGRLYANFQRRAERKGITLLIAEHPVTDHDFTKPISESTIPKWQQYCEHLVGLRRCPERPNRWCVSFA